MQSPKVNPRKAQGMVIKSLKMLPADVSWNDVKAILRQQFSLVPTIAHSSHQVNTYIPTEGRKFTGI